MTGRELIIYILANNLEDEPIYNKNRECPLIGYMTDRQAAVKFNTGVPTVIAWVKMGLLDGIYIGGQLFIAADSIRPTERKTL